MDNFDQFVVDDTSPLISYSPFRDTLSVPNLGAGWNPYYNESGFASSLGEVGNGTSLHITSLDGASLGFQWRGTGIQLAGNVTFASYEVMVDGQSIPSSPSSDGTTLLNVTGLPDALHNITLTAHISPGQNPANSSMLVFDKAIITSSPIPDSSNVSSRLQPLDDNEVAFLGHWSFHTAPSGASFHTSITSGDRALTTFSGSTFLLQGVTSPTATNYTVTIDNATSSILNGQSSFTSYNSLLFFASDLDPNGTHSVEVRNVGSGELSLITPPPPSTPSPIGTVSSMSFAKGTIAAFVLAGILAFLLLSGLLFFFLVYRPRKLRQRRRDNRYSFTQSPKEREAGMVLDISHNGPGDPDKEMDAEEEDASSGFARWRRGAVHGSFGGIGLPIHFRHSDATQQKDDFDLPQRPTSEMSDPPSSNSSAKRKARAKSKGKARQITGRSFSPSIKLTLPMQQLRTSTSQSPSPATRITSWGALSSFVAAEPSPQKLRHPDPPSYAASVSHHDSNRGSNSNPSSAIPSGPRSVTDSPGHPSYQAVHHRDTSKALLLHQREPSSDQDMPEADQDSPKHMSGTGDSISMMPMQRHDENTVMFEDNQSIIEPSNLREVIRSLSPRTSEAPHRQSRWHEGMSESSVYESPAGLPAQIDSVAAQRDLNRRSRPLPKIPVPVESVDDDVEVHDGVFLDVRATSPFRVDFDSRSAKVLRNGSQSESSSGRRPHTAPSSTKPSRKSSATSNMPRSSIARQLPEFIQGPSRWQFRLTPMTPPAKPSSSDHSDAVTSFLDLTASAQASLRSNSIRSASDTEKSAQYLRLSVPGVNEPRSRWSNTTVPTISTNLTRQASSEGESSGESQRAAVSEARSTDGSSMFPFSVHVDIPPSPHHVIDISASNRRSQTSAFTQAGTPLHTHPPMEDFESPTESIPRSVSEIRFRTSPADDDSHSRQTAEGASLSFSPAHPAHPPLPGSPSTVGQFAESNAASTLGLPSSTSTPTALAYTRTASPSASTALLASSSTSQRPNISHEHLDSSAHSEQNFS
ncbi:hypothetical protein D9613_000204 [Agrocybe pediades]|uniref:Uncharacterized protein n=1 Tax=Agrocybe pediades TaxID=84607 RepID=A0A8H4R014_9AGAR|nr:hypothetical protein D9613_000204 [Agrocybe pediades]